MGIAWRTLWITTISMFFGFVTWYIVAAIAPRLNEIGFDLTAAQLYWLTESQDWQLVSSA